MIYKTLKFVVLGSVAMASLGLAGAVFAETRYVTDELEVTLRSGQSTRNNIVRMLKSGTALEVLEDSGDTGYSLVRLPSGTEGWVLSRFLVNQPVARDVLPDVQRRYAALVESSKSTSAKLNASSSSLSGLEKERDTLRSENEQLAKQLHEAGLLSTSGLNQVNRR